MKRILITAFEPFGGRKTNASAEVLKRLPGRIGEYEVDKVQLPVVFGKAAEKVPREGYESVFLLGEAGRDLVTPETTARNLREARIPDNEGNQPKGGEIAADGQEEYHTSIPVEDIVEQMKEEGYEIAVSSDAGSFVCNDTFYLVGTGSSVPVEFIHVPCRMEEGIYETVYRFVERAVSSISLNPDKE